MLARTDPAKTKHFRPDYIADSVAEIDYQHLSKQGVKAVLVDLDGTVVMHGQFEVSQPTSDALKNQPLDVYIATNRPKSRDLKDLMLRLHAQGVVHPDGLRGKPLKSYYTNALSTLNLQPGQVAMVGDRYLQDIFGANRAGLVTVLVRKLDKPSHRLDRWLSGAENRRTERLLKHYTPIG